ncbi:MAG: D-alanine--D-alanine ligase, partial [Reyranella sp.]|nr:D-alanine--D-alanine ligase [Reyranella sp.]
RLDAIASSMPHLHVARFDIRFASLAELGQGRFKIIEINGAGSEAIEFFDPAVPFFIAYRGILEKQAMVFALAAENRAAGFTPCGWRTLLRAYSRQARLLDRYPASN